MSLSVPQRSMVKLYNASTKMSVDQLPYTREFDKLFTAYRKQGHELTRQEFWKQLTNLRKAGELKRKSKPPRKLVAA